MRSTTTTKTEKKKCWQKKITVQLLEDQKTRGNRQGSKVLLFVQAGYSSIKCTVQDTWNGKYN